MQFNTAILLCMILFIRSGAEIPVTIGFLFSDCERDIIKPRIYLCIKFGLKYFRVYQPFKISVRHSNHFCMGSSVKYDFPVIAE